MVIVSKGVKPKKILSKLTGNRFFLCFIEDYTDRKKWEEFLSASFRKFETKAAIEKYKKELRAHFLNFIDQMGEKSGDLWPLSPVSEQNTFTSNLFLDCIRLKILDELISRGEKEIIIVVEDPFLFKAVKNLARKRGLRIKTKRDLAYYLNLLKVKCSPFFHLGKFTLTCIGHRFAARAAGERRVDPIKRNGTNIILHTWIDDGCFTRDGQYKDRYFGALIDWLVEKGHNLFIVPYIYNTRRPLREVYNMLGSAGFNFIFPCNYYRLSDYWQCILHAIRIMSIPSQISAFQGIDVSDLIKRDSQRQLGGFLHFYMYTFLFDRLKEHGYIFDEAIDVFEGMIPERAWIKGFLKASPRGTTIGYQHTLFSTDLLCYFVYRGKSLKSVIPHKIVCTGEMIKDLLVKEGLPEDHLTVGCALRYEYLWKSKKELVPEGGSDGSTTTRKILVGLPLQSSGAAELLAVLSNMAKKRRELAFFIKPHPMMSRMILQKILEETSWPISKTHIAEGSMDEWLSKVDLLISTASAAVVDALVSGKPVLIMGREGVLDLNPLDWINSEFTRTYYGEREIEERIDALLRMGEKDMEILRSFGRNILTGCFNPVTDETLSVFLPS